MAINVIAINNQSPLPLEVSLYLATAPRGAGSVIWQQAPAAPNGPGLAEWDDGTAAVLADFADGVFAG
jgi:hypothetical protein